MRKSGLPILKILFPDGTEKAYWNTFYQKITYQEITIDDLLSIPNLSTQQAEEICEKLNKAIADQEDFNKLDIGAFKSDVIQIGNKNKPLWTESLPIQR